MTKFSRFLIAAPSSGSGKTTVTLGLLRALKNRNSKVQPFKCGPDYIDTKLHTLVSGTEAINLDLFLSSANHIEQLFAKYATSADVCVTEGVMGLFDGFDKMKGSAAEIAGLLDIPVIMVVNAKSVAYSVAPLLYGFKNFLDTINVVGVIFNFVGSESHYSFLKDACDDVGIEALGYLPKNTDVEIPSRYLGLSMDEQERIENFADHAATLIEKHIDVDRLLELTQTTKPTLKPQPQSNSKNLAIAVAKDEAFNFMYHENIEALRAMGDVTFFSPIHDKILPHADFIYLPGGYPEMYAKVLSENQEIRLQLKKYADQGGQLLAECGGMMYLCSSIVDEHGQEFPMVNIFEQRATMENMKLKLGYRQFEYNNCPMKGHEFHYSHIENEQTSVAQLYTAKGMQVPTKLLRYKNVIAGYTHLYWAENKNILDLFQNEKQL